MRIINNIQLREVGFDEKTREAIFYSQLSNTTYDMDDEKRKYEELLKNSNSDDKEKNDFKNFLKNNFFPQEWSTAVDCVDDVDCGWRDTEVQNDDEFVQLLKTATLLSRTEWEFRNIREILDVKYNNLVVKKLEDLTFDISIVDSTLSVPVLLNNREMKISADFNSSYELEWGHFFSDILLKPFTPESNWGKKYIFNDIELSIKWNISIETFEESMKKIYENFDYIEWEYKEYTLKNTWRIRQIEFTPDTKLVNFK